jgi:hypothetical protein
MAATAQLFAHPAADGFGADVVDPSVADPAAALTALMRRAQALAAEPMSPAQRFGALEALRPASVRAAAAQRTLYYGRPHPLSTSERAGWEEGIGLWQALYLAYALCADAGLEPQMAATVSQRALDSLGRAIRSHACVYRAAPGALWRELHTCFRSAAECALLDVPVQDECQAGAQASCKTAYLATLLHDCADPYTLSARQMQALEQLLPHWLGRVDILASEPLWASRSPLALDLAADCGARLAHDLGSGEGIRYLDTSALGMHLRELANGLRNAQPAAELDTAGDMPRPALERLLTQLYVQWCSAGSGRMEERQATRAQAALGMHAVHFQISGRAFRQPGLRYTREEEHDLATFGHITERTEQRLLTGRSAALEPWEIVNQSAAGMINLRRKPDLESRIAHGQLIALRTSSIDPPLLAVVQRLQADANGELNIGVRTLRGESRGAGVRPAGDTAAKYERAFLLEADAGRNVPASLIVPAGRFAPRARIEVSTGRVETVTLGEPIERGFDFDRVAFERA